MVVDAPAKIPDLGWKSVWLRAAFLWTSPLCCGYTTDEIRDEAVGSSQRNCCEDACLAFIGLSLVSMLAPRIKAILRVCRLSVVVLPRVSPPYICSSPFRRALKCGLDLSSPIPPPQTGN